MVDDEPQIRRVIRPALAALGYEPYEARSGEEALQAVGEYKPEVILLDMNMPGMGGLAACKEIRAVSEVAIIILSVRDSEKDKIAALDAGADDYITKPFSVNELMARIRANLRRLPMQPERSQAMVVSSELTIDLSSRQVIKKNGESVRLTPKEFDLLQYLISNANKPIAHRKLLQVLWGPEYGDEVEYLRVFVSQLRKKIETDPGKPRYILTEPWVGYRFAIACGPMSQRGKLKIFLGYAAGVGKTYQMLEEAQNLKAKGVDVVIGYFEPHGRKDTIAKTEGLETVPRKIVQYRGSAFEEMDTEAIIARHPQVAVVDEFPHTNVPGSPREKRWEDVLVILGTRHRCADHYECAAS